MNARALTLAFRLGVRQAVKQPFAVVGQLLIYLVLMLSYGAIVKAIPVRDLTRLSLTAPQMVWYIILTETVMMLGLWHCRKFQNDIANGQMDIWLLRPMPFWMLLLAEWAGQEIIRLLPTAMLAIVLGRLISGVWLDAAPSFLLIPSTVLGGMILLLCSAILLGLVTIWIGNTTAGLWIYFKCVFVLGAMLWPMIFYPDWLRHLAFMTPFPSILANTGALVLPITVGTIVAHAAEQIFWVIMMLAACGLVSEAARRRLAK